MTKTRTSDLKNTSVNGIRKLFLLFGSYLRVLPFLFLISAPPVFAQTSLSSGDWSVGTNWSGGTAPPTSGQTTGTITVEHAMTIGTAYSASGSVALNVTSTGSLTVSGNVSFAQSLTIGSPSLTGGTMTINGNLSTGANATITIRDGATLTINGSFSAQNIVINVNSGGTLIVTGSVAIAGANSNFNIDGSFHVYGNLTGSGNNDTTITGAGSVEVNGNLTVPSGNLNGPVGSFIVHGSCSGTYCGNSALPIILVSFKATEVTEGIRLTWSTSSELNFDHFNLQRSIDGFIFETIATIAGHGTSNTAHLYSYTDKPVVGTSYYRLQSVDFDGFAETFKVIAVNFKGSKEASLYPMPVMDSKLNIQLNFIPEKEVSITVCDPSGSVVSQGKMKAGESDFTIPLFVSPGLYFVRLSGEIQGITKIMVR